MALPRDPGGRRRPPLKRHSSFPLPKPEIQRSAPPKRKPIYGPPAPKPKPVGVFHAPITPPTTTLRHAQRQAAQRTRHAARPIAKPVPYVPVIAPKNQPHNYIRNVERIAGPLAHQVHNRAIAEQREGGSYKQSVSAQLDALGPGARRLFRAYLETVGAANRQATVGARVKENQRRVAMGLPPLAISQARPRQGKGGVTSALGDAAGMSLGLLPRFLAGAVANRAEQSGASNLAGVLRLTREPEQIARTYIEHPETVSKDFGYVRDFLLGTAAIPYSIIHNGPADSLRSLTEMAKTAPQALIQDEINRHKYAFQGNYGAFRKVVQQTGAIPYGFDYASVLAGAGKGAGLLAKGGALGRRLEEFANTPRARLRIAPGERRLQRDETRKTAPNLFRLHYQGKRDVARARSFERKDVRARQRAAEFNRRGEPGQGNRRFNQPEAYPGEGPGKPRMSVRQLAARRAAAEQSIERAGGKLHRDKRGRVESVRFTASRAAEADSAHFRDVSRRLEAMGFEKRRVGGNLVFYAPKEVVRRSLFMENKAARSIPAHLKGVAVQQIRGVSADVAHEFQQAAGPAARALRVKGLSRHERAALFLAGTGRLPADNPARARELLTRLEQRIRKEIGAKPRTRYETDVLKRIAYLKKHADEAFTPRLRAALDSIRGQVRRGERENPFLIPRQRVAARYGPPAVDFDVERGSRQVQAYDPIASAKSIARHEEKVRGRERGKLQQGESALRERDRGLRDEQVALNERMAGRSKTIDGMAREAEFYEERSRSPHLSEAERAAARAQGSQMREAIGRIVSQNEQDWVRANKIGRQRDALDRQMLEMRRGPEGTSGRPNADVAKIDWYHGTPMRYSGPPTSEGKWSDLGVYLTSDPGYALHGYAGGPGGGGRVMKLRVAPERIIDTRFGRVDPGAIAEVARRLLKRADEATGVQAARFGEAHDQILPHRAGQLNALRPVQRQILEGIERMMSDPENPMTRAVSGKVKHTGEAQREALRNWQEIDGELRQASVSIAEAEGKRGGIGHKPLKEVLQGMGYDAVRKVDVYADALVVLDEKLLGRRPRSDEMRQWLLDGAKKERGETTAEWAKRVRRVMEENGIDHPPFFAPSEELRTPKFSIHTAGGARSPEPPKTRTYVLQRQGRERTDPEIIYEGIQRNHRTRISAQLVADVFDRVAHHRYRDLTVHELKKIAQREGFDPSQYAVWYPKLYKDTLRGKLVGELEDARTGAGAAASNLETGAFQAEGGMRHLQAMLDPQSKDSAIVAADNIRDLQRQLDDPRFKAERGTLIPRVAADELLSSAKETAFGRMMERLKTLQSRAVLGGLNFNWVQADAVVNSLVATVFGGASPAAFLQQHRFFRNLPADVKGWAHDELDIGTSRSNTHISRMGAAVNNRFVNFFRFWRESPWGQRVRPIQKTINTFLRLERSVGNNPQRRALAYHLLRKEAFRQLDENVGHMNGLMNRVQSVFTLGAYTPAAVQKQMVQIIRHKKDFEEIGRQTANILGDWTTFTALERKTLGRYLFFYPYLRYSMKLAFYTLPLDHPVRLAIVANLANLNMDEQRKLVGAKEEDTYLLAGRYFYRDAEGQFHEYNVRTFNPVGNTLTEAESSLDLLQLLPPAFTIGLGQVMKRDIYRDRSWRVKGTANEEAAKDIGPLDGLLGTTRWRVLAKNLIELPPLTRELAKYMLPGEQGDDSLPFSPRPTEFKDPERQAQADKKRARERVSLAQRFLQDQVRVLTSKPSDIEDVLSRRRSHEKGGASGSAPAKPTGMSTSAFNAALERARRAARTHSSTPGQQAAALKRARRAAGIH